MTGYITWPAKEGTNSLTYLDSQHVSREEEDACSICLDVGPYNEALDEEGQGRSLRELGHLRLGCCTKQVHFPCLEKWKSSQEAIASETHGLLTFNCPTCRRTLDGRIFYRITQEDYDQSEQVSAAIDRRDYPKLRTTLKDAVGRQPKEYYLQKYPLTFQGGVHKAAASNDVRSLKLLREYHAPLDSFDRERGFYQTPLFSATVRKSHEAMQWLISHGVSPNGSELGRPINVAMKKADLRAMQILNETRNVGFSPYSLLYFYLGKARVMEASYNISLDRWTNIFNIPWWRESTKRISTQFQFERLELQIYEACVNAGLPLEQFNSFEDPFDPNRKIKIGNLFARVGSLEVLKQFEHASAYSREYKLQELLGLGPREQNKKLEEANATFEEIIGDNTDLPIFDALHSQKLENFEYLLAETQRLAGSHHPRRFSKGTEPLITEAVKAAMNPDIPSEVKFFRKYPEKIKLIKSAYPNCLSAIDREGFTPVHAAAFLCRTKEDYKILEQTMTGDSMFGGDPQRDEARARSRKSFEDGLLPLHLYALNHHSNLEAEPRRVVLSLARGTDERRLIDEKDNKGNTVLHHAVQAYYSGVKHKRMRRMIRDIATWGGGDTKAKNNLGETPESICESHTENVLLSVRDEFSTM